VKSSAPLIYEFDDYRAYLRALLVYWKGQRSGGLKELAEKAGFRSSSAMSMVLSGQRKLSRDMAERLGSSIGLNARGQLYLGLLVRQESAKSEEEKVLCREKMIFLKSRSPKLEMTLSQYRLLAVWYYPVLYAMASSGELTFDTEKIARRLKRGVTSTMVKRAIGDLINLKLLEQRGKSLVQTKGSITTTDEIKNLSIQRYHHSMLGLAKEALELPVEAREFTGLTVNLSKTKLAQAKQRIREFRKELSELLTSSGPGEVYQLNVQFFPLTDEGESA